MILHIALRDVWETSVPGGYYKPSSLSSEGFIHCSTIEQTVDTANQFFSNQQDLVLLCIDENKSESKVKYEGPACANDQRTSSLFPHIYGPLNVSAVVRVVEFVPNTDGKFVLPAEINSQSKAWKL